MDIPRKPSPGFVTILLIPITVIVFLLSVASGHYSIPLADIIAVLTGRREGISPRVAAILLNVRIPRGAAALLAGMGLSCSGAAYQSLFRNPMAAPDVLGAVAGASFGAALGILLNRSEALIQLLAFCGGLAAVGLTCVISSVVNRKQRGIIMILLVGMVSAAFFSALVSVVKYFADVDSQLPALTFWLLGGLAGVSPGSVAAASVLIITSLVILFYKRWVLNLISFEDEESLSMGINLRRERGLIIVLSTLMCSASVSLCGPVGWVGLLIPHAARMFWGSNYRALLPAVALLGGLYLMLMDGIARNAAMVEIPLGAITAIIGAPLFIFLLFRGNYFRD